MRNACLLLACALAVAACQSPPEAIAQAPDASADASDDACRSRQFAPLVGQDRARAPASTEGYPVRVVCSTCPMTMDYNAQRLNVVFDEKSGKVQSLSCG